MLTLADSSPHQFFSDDDVAFAMSRCVLPYRVPARRLAYLDFKFASLCCLHVPDSMDLYVLNGY